MVQNDTKYIGQRDMEMRLWEDIPECEKLNKEIKEQFMKMGRYAMEKGISYGGKTAPRKVSRYELEVYSRMIRHFDRLVMERDAIIFNLRKERNKKILAEYNLVDGEHVHLPTPHNYNGVIFINREGVICFKSDNPEILVFSLGHHWLPTVEKG